MACSGALAASGKFPAKNVKIIVPFSPGGGVDVTCRMISELGPKYLNGKKIVVENMPGGGAVIGQTFVSRAKPDGYTVLGFTSSVVNNPMTKKTSYTHESFQTVAMYCFDPEVIVVPKDSPFKTLKEFLDKAKTDEISMATAGYSSSHHIAAMMLEARIGVKFGYIHNSSSAMQIQQLMGGHVQAGIMSFGEASGYQKDGSLRILGIMESDRPKDFPEVETFKENGIDMVWGPFRGLAVPKATPAEVVAVLETAFKGIINDPIFRERMAKAGYPVVYRSAKDFETYVDNVAEVMKGIVPTLKKK